MTSQNKWDENRLKQSRLENLAKAREVAKLKKLEKESGFSVSPVINEPENPEIAPQYHNDAVEAQDPTPNRVIDGASTIFFAILTFGIPLAVNALIDYTYPLARDYYLNRRAAATNTDVHTKESARPQWYGNTLFRQ